ncbi:MAG: DUF1343 domain-containing protein [Gemmatimonadaceae bacterium]
MTDHGKQRVRAMVSVALACAACAQAPRAQDEPRGRGGTDAVRPGITVLIEDSLAIIAGKRIAIITNQTGVDANGVSDVELLQRDPRAVRAGIAVVRLFSPEHGIRGTADRPDLPDELDRRSGLMVHSLYATATRAPPDSLLRDLDAVVFDLQDIGTRTWTYVGVMVYAMRAAARVGIPFIVLDRPNPLGGRVEGPLLDSALANAEDPSAERPGQAYALYPAPLRHGMTMGELARLFAAELAIPVRLHVMPAAGWRREMWWEESRLPWVVPSPAMVSTTSALVYPALVAFERSNLSVGRGTSLPFQRFGAPWLDAERVAGMLNDRGLSGVRFQAERFTPRSPTDGKHGGREIPGVRIVVEDRDRVQVARLGAAILWAVGQAAPDSLVINARGFDLRFGSPEARATLLEGRDPDEVIDRMLADVHAFQLRVRPYLLYR